MDASTNGSKYKLIFFYRAIDFAIDIDEEVALASDTTSLIDRVATKLLAGNISDDLKSSIKDVIDLYTDEPDRQASIAIYLIVTSPEFTVQG